MSLIVPDVGEIQLLNLLRLAWSPTIRLFTNPVTIGPSSVAADFLEATFPGYAAVLSSGWTFPSSEATGRAATSANQVLFTRASNGSPAQIYGYFVTDGMGNLLWAETDPNGPVPFNGAGNEYRVVPRFTLKSEF